MGHWGVVGVCPASTRPLDQVGPGLAGKDANFSRYLCKRKHKVKNLISSYSIHNSGYIFRLLLNIAPLINNNNVLPGGRGGGGLIASSFVLIKLFFYHHFKLQSF